MNPLAVLARIHQTRIQQDTHMVRERRLTDLQRVLQPAGAALTRMQKRKDRQAILIAHRLENTSHLLIGALHDTTL